MIITDAQVCVCHCKKANIGLHDNNRCTGVSSPETKQIYLCMIITAAQVCQVCIMTPGTHVSAPATKQTCLHNNSCTGGSNLLHHDAGYTGMFAPETKQTYICMKITAAQVCQVCIMTPGTQVCLHLKQSKHTSA